MRNSSTTTTARLVTTLDRPVCAPVWKFTALREKLPDAVTVFILPPSYEVLERRLRGRGQDDEPTIRRRLAAAGRELHAFVRYDYAIVNDDLDRCVGALESIVRAARCRVSHATERARAIERTFESAKEKEEV